MALPLTVFLSACGATDPLPQATAGENELQRHHLTAPAPEHLERYGAAAAVIDDLAVVGAWGNSRHGHEAGAAYVYRYDEAASEWALDGGALYPDEPAPGTRFGHAVALGADVIAVSAIYDGSRGYRAGAVHLYERGSMESAAEGWKERGKLLPPPGSDNAHFGSAIALEKDTLAVSSAGAGATRIDIYSRSNEGWQKTDSVSAPEGAVDQYFGGDIALREDILIVGASHRGNSAPGAAYLYRRGEGGWSYAGALEGAGGEPLFGTSVDFGPTGLLAVGAPGAAEGGAVYLYRLRGVDGSGFGTEQEQILRPAAGGHPHFGSALALAGESLVVGSPGAAHEGFSSGLVQIYRHEEASDEWVLASEIAPSMPTDGMAFGITVAASDRFLTIGATGEVDGETISGSLEIVPLQSEPASLK